MDDSNHETVRYHPDGTWAQKFKFVNGKEHGISLAQRSKNKSDEVAMTWPSYEKVFSAEFHLNNGVHYHSKYFNESGKQMGRGGKTSKLKKEFAASLRGMEVPKSLDMILDLEIDFGFESLCRQFSVCADTEEPSQLSTYSTKKNFCKVLYTIGTADGSGGYYYFWNANEEFKRLEEMPVVMFDSEGGTAVVASHLTDLLRILSFDAEPNISDDEVSFYKEPDESGSSYKETFHRLLTVGLGIEIVTDASVVADITKVANKKFGKSFSAFCKKYL